MVERTAMAESSESLNTQPSSFNRLCDIVAKLRAPGGCPWDQEQTHESLLPATIGETYEVAEAAWNKEDGHFPGGLRGLLFLGGMYAEIARGFGRFKSGAVLCQ